MSTLDSLDDHVVEVIRTGRRNRRNAEGVVPCRRNLCLDGSSPYLYGSNHRARETSSRTFFGNVIPMMAKDDVRPCRSKTDRAVDFPPDSGYLCHPFFYLDSAAAKALEVCSGMDFSSTDRGLLHAASDSESSGPAFGHDDEAHRWAGEAARAVCLCNDAAVRKAKRVD